MLLNSLNFKDKKKPSLDIEFITVLHIVPIGEAAYGLREFQIRSLMTT
jgi:hypothetical protein